MEANVEAETPGVLEGWYRKYCISGLLQIDKSSESAVWRFSESATLS